MSVYFDFEQLTERVYEKYPKDPDIWKLLQEVVSMYQDLEKCKKDIETLGKAISPMLMAEVICRMRKDDENSMGKAEEGGE